MPLYEFECVQCVTVFEELVRMGSTGEGLHCPSCGHDTVRKKMSTFYGRSAGSDGASHSVAGSSCNCGGNCGGDCGSCGGGCSCGH